MLTSVVRKHRKYKRGECYSYSIADIRKEDGKALENIGEGLGLMRGTAPHTWTLPLMNKYTGTLNADMVSGGIASLTGKIVSPDGTEVAIALGSGNGGTFATDQTTTATNIKNYLEGLSADLICTVSGSNRVFTLTLANNKRFVITVGFARGGSGTATFTNTKDSTLTVRAISERNPLAFNQVSFTNTDTEPFYFRNQWVPGVVAGDPAVPVVGTVSIGGVPYCLLEDYTDGNSVLNPRGSFRADNDSGNAPVVALASGEFSDTKDSGLAPTSLFRA